MAQAIRQTPGGGQTPPAAPAEEKKSEEKKTPTEKSYCTGKDIYCTALQTARTDRDAAKEAYTRSLEIYDKRKLLFEWTEKNYRMYRNLDLCLDTELTTGNAALTTNVTAYTTLSQNLYKGLTGITTAAKALKVLVNTLRDRASDLENFKNDQCNAGQWGLLTGENVENCKPAGGKTPVHHEPPDVCKDAAKIYEELISITKKSLVFDVDSLVQSSADVTGIQTFSNIAVLPTLQSVLSNASSAFVQQIQNTVKGRLADLNTTQDNLVSATKDCTNAGVNNFNKIAIYSGAHSTMEFLCHPDCGCAPKLELGNPVPRLHDCECNICRIGEAIKGKYPGSPQSTTQPPASGAPAATGGTPAATGGAASPGAAPTPTPSK